jgi:hypothetical protein
MDGEPTRKDALINRRSLTVYVLAIALGRLLAGSGSAVDESPGQLAAAELLRATGVQGGLIVHLGCGDGKLTAALRANGSYLVQGLDADAKNIEAARRHIQSLGLDGKVSAEPWSGWRFPYADSLVNLLVAQNPGETTKEEMMRVLAPAASSAWRRAGIGRRA